MNKNVFKEFPTFVTERLIIRPFTQSDFKNYVIWHNVNDIIYHHGGLYNFNQESDFNKFFLQRVPRMYQAKVSGIWCIAKKITDVTIGLIEVCKYDSYANTAQIHYCMAEEERCKGYMTEAIGCMLKWAFDIVELNRIYTYVCEENTASSKVLLKNGFQLEGTMRQSSANKYTKSGQEIKETKKDSRFIAEKEYKNVCIYAILKDEYNLSIII